MVVPSFEDVGGVTTMTEFVLRTIRRRDDFDVRIVSLATSSHDPASLLLTRPSTWLAGAQTRPGKSHGETYTHVGAVLGEIETQRLKPRAVLRRLLADCALVQVVAGVPAWASVTAGCGVPVAAFVATMIAVERRRPLLLERGLKGVWRKAMTRRVARMDEEGFRQVDAVTVMNPWMLEQGRRANDGRDTIVRYGPPGLDISKYTPLATRDPSRAYILSVGRFDDTRKNVELLLEAYAQMDCGQDERPALVLAGAAGPGESFWKRAAALGLADRIRYVASASKAELAILYRDAQTFALVSDEEGFGIVVIEAMASGVPVVSTRSGGPEAIVSDGEDGYLVDRNDAAGIAARLSRLATDAALNLQMGHKARQKAVSQFSDEATGNVYLDIYDTLLAGRVR